MPPPATPTLTLGALTSLDWLLLLIVAISAISAFRRGLIRVLFSFAGLAAGTLLASWNYLQLAHALHPWLAHFEAAQVVAFLLILIGVMILFSVAAAIVRRTAKAIGLGIFDRLFGGMLGAARGVALGVALMLALTAFMPNSPWLKNSALVPYFLTGAHAVSFVVPGRLKAQLAAGTALMLHERPTLLRPHRDWMHLEQPGLSAAKTRL